MKHLLAAGSARRLLFDACLAIIAVALSTGAALYGPSSTTHRLSGLGVAFALVSIAAVTVRRLAPRVVFGVISGLSVLALVFGLPHVTTGGALLIAAGTIGLTQARVVAVIAGGVTAGVLLVLTVVRDGLGGLRAENMNVVILTLLATAAGIAIHDRRVYLAGLLERADRAERTRESEAARRVAEERVRIARDLHDSLAHHMAVVNVQTGVALHLLRSDPDSAATALGHARSAAGLVLDELGTVLGVLRTTSDGESTEPAPSIGRLSGLIEPLRAAGLDLRSSVAGLPRPLPPLVDQAAYRLIQEALTNVQKHAAGSQVSLTVAYDQDAVSVQVVNSGVLRTVSPVPESAGFGLAGMRERCAAVGGRLETGLLAGGGFRVFAQLPTPDARTLAAP